MNCKHCNQQIHETSDPNLPFVHDASGNSYCDVAGPTSAVENRALMLRNEAEPEHEDDGFGGSHFSSMLFSNN